PPQAIRGPRTTEHQKPETRNLKTAPPSLRQPLERAIFCAPQSTSDRTPEPSDQVLTHIGTMSDRPAILVTGAAGFIGSHVVERLLARGDRVVGLDNFDPFYSPEEKRENLASALLSPRFRLVEADCAELDEMERALEGETFDVVVHLAAKAGVRPSIEDPVGYARANLTGTQAMLELA